MKSDCKLRLGQVGQRLEGSSAAELGASLDTLKFKVVVYFEMTVMTFFSSCVVY